MLSTVLGGKVASWASFTDGMTLRCEVGPDVAEFSFAGGQLEVSFTRGALVTLIARSQEALATLDETRERSAGDRRVH
ncbi:hypothetical protein [Saccharothrix longispora]|uniref:hypothetical protein n=1 Tax=Saccharothrix longispora TaxID=33920 RepID=UPI0028FD11D6|nr:hypothetical protein [Saccharothrix longispora]MDU0288412.1 hypothetical protein [Saccharothrix longispora]